MKKNVINFFIFVAAISFVRMIGDMPSFEEQTVNQINDLRLMMIIIGVSLGFAALIYWLVPNKK